MVSESRSIHFDSLIKSGPASPAHSETERSIPDAPQVALATFSNPHLSSQARAELLVGQGHVDIVGGRKTLRFRAPATQEDAAAAVLDNPKGLAPTGGAKVRTHPECGRATTAKKGPEVARRTN